MSAQLMGLVRELKALNARKKAGETLSTTEESRRKELKAFLKTQLEGGGEDASTSQAARPPATSTPPSPPEMSKPVPRPATMSSPPPTPAPIRPPPTPPPMRSPVVPQAAAPTPTQAPAPKPYVPKKDAFAIAGAASFLDAAMNSDAVAKVDPWAGRKVSASQGEIDDAEARAEAALKANKKRERVSAPEDVERQLKEVQGGYTPPSDDYCLEQYYGDYFGEGMSVAGGAEVADLKPIDPREIEVRRAIDIAAGPSSGSTSATVPPGLAFLDDFSALYAKRVLPPPGDEVSLETEDPTLLIGRRKVTVHLINGEKKQGSIKQLRRGELGFRLEGAGVVEEIALSQIKAVFVHLQPNAQPKGGAGRNLTVMFRDQRAVQGDSDDYAPNAPVFTLIPPAGRGQFEKIVINAAAVASVS